MKGFLILLSALFIAVAFTASAQAEVIEGNASSDVTVNNSIQGSGEVHTHIESTVNGQTKVLDSNQPGSYTLHNSSSVSSSSTASISPTITPKPKPKPTITSTLAKTTQDPIKSLEVFFHTVIQKLLSALRV